MFGRIVSCFVPWGAERHQGLWFRLAAWWGGLGSGLFGPVKKTCCGLTACAKLNPCVRT